MDLPVRPMRPADLEAVLEIERASFGTPWSERTFRNLLRRSNAHLFVAEQEGGTGGLAGYAVLWIVGREAELGDLAVRRDLRRRGIGRRLVAAVVRAARALGARTVFLEVRESNEAARGLYERAGFEMVGRRRGYYANPCEDALVMRREVARTAPGGAPAPEGAGPPERSDAAR